MSHTPTPQSAIPSLIDGYRQFKKGQQMQAQFYEELATEGQKAKVLVIACCDARVLPSMVTNAIPGELFVVRNVANLVPPFNSDPRHHGTSAALEFGVLGLNVTDIVVFGHSHCGGIKAMMESESKSANSDFIHAWMDIATPAKEKVLADHPNTNSSELNYYCEKQSLLVSIDNLMTFPWIQSRVEENQLHLHAWYFDLATGAVEAYQTQTTSFVELENWSPPA